MTAIAIFGTTEASEKLVRASLNETLEAHVAFKMDEPFELMLSNEDNPTVKAIIQWADECQVPYAVFGSPRSAMDEAHHRPNVRVLALIGDEEPTGDVAVALQLANIYGHEIRDLAEAGLTYVYQEGEPLDKETTVPSVPTKKRIEEKEDYSWEELGILADDEDDERQSGAAQVLAESAQEHDIDYESADSWADVAAEIEAAEDLGQDAQAEALEEVTPDEEPEQVGWTTADFKGKGIKEVREIAKQSGVVNYSKLSRDELVEALVGVVNGDADLPQPPAPYGEGDTSAPTADPTDFPPAVIDAIANAVIAKLAARLSA